MGRDYLKCAVLCYNLGRWKFERSIRLCMEFKITWNKSVRRNKILLSFQQNKENEVFVVAFIRRSQGWTEPFRTSRAARPFSRQNSNLRLDFPFRRLMKATTKTSKPPKKRWNSPKGQQKSRKVSTFSLFCWKEGKILFRRALLTQHNTAHFK